MRIFARKLVFIYALGRRHSINHFNFMRWCTLWFVLSSPFPFPKGREKKEDNCCGKIYQSRVFGFFTSSSGL
jgi:hypothetical protein